jgi:hypothetical protein
MNKKESKHLIIKITKISKYIWNLQNSKERKEYSRCRPGLYY